MSDGRHSSRLTRRQFLNAASTGIVGTVAGCTASGQRDSLAPDRGPFSEKTVQKAREMANEAEKGVLALTELQERTLGTAWHIGDGYLLTNAHNVNPAAGQPRIQVGPYPGTRDHDAELLGKKQTDGVDLAMLRAPIADRPSLSYASSTDLSKGQPLVSVGHPRGVGNWITMLGSFHEYHEYPETEYDIEERPREIRSYTSSRKGASGSPTLTLDGTVVGCLFGGRVINSEVAPRRVHTDLADFPMVTQHVDAGVFDAYISKWK